MTACWLCREDVTQALANMPPSHIGIHCPSCLVSINREGGRYHEEQPGTVNVVIALARATDRLARAMDGNTQATRDIDQTVKDKP